MAFWVPLLLTAASLYSADQQQDAIKDASRAQTGANRDAQEFQRNALLASMTQGYPLYRGQINALNRLYSMQGLPSIRAAEFDSIVSPFRPNATSPGQPRPGQPTPEQVSAARDRAREFAVTGF